MPDNTRITPPQRRQAPGWLLGGLAGLLLGIAILARFPTFLPGYGLALLGLVSLGIGLKLRLTPPCSLILAPEGLYYQHPAGHWALAWDNLIRIDPLQLEGQALPYLGLKLQDPDPVLGSMSLRLAGRLLVEQRELMLYLLRQQCASGACALAGEGMDEDRYRTGEGEQLNGLLAVFANRCRRLREGLGYDLYLPFSALDREPEAFIALCRQYRRP